MKFVHGRTLKDAILEYHSADASAKVPREVQRLQLLEVFVDLCHATAFAHNRGVLHRDLKPTNIMLGQFGETVLLDWGLAKVMDQPEQPGDASYVHVSSSSGSTATQDGSVLGSPAYMAPEVAEGRIAEVDETTNVYLLGATLYEILTGRPPREGSSNLEMLDLARTVSPAAPRKLDRSISPALEAICLKAMAQRMQGRYPTALEVAEDVQRYLAAEPVSAYRESLPQRARRWCKRHRRLLKRAAVAAVVVACAMSVFTVVRENARLQAVEQARSEVKQFRRFRDETWYYASSSDPATEHAPYYDLRKGISSGQAALKVAGTWGPDLGQLPLEKDRPSLKEELYDLHLLMVQARLQTTRAPNMVADVLELLDRAPTFRDPTRSYYRLRADCSELLDKDRRAEAKNVRTPTTALDHFLLGEHHRTLSLKETSDTHRHDSSGDPWSWGVNKPVLQKASGLGGRSAALSFEWGMARKMLGRSDDALVVFSKGIELWPEDVKLRVERGDTYEKLGQHDRALDDFREAVGLDPQNVEALARLAFARAKGKSRPEAEQSFPQSLRSRAEFIRLFQQGDPG